MIPRRFSWTNVPCAMVISILLANQYSHAQNDPANARLIFERPKEISHTLAEDEALSFFSLSADNDWVVYRVNKTDADGDFIGSALFSVPTDGGTARQITRNTDSNSAVGRWDISPDSKRVVYTQLAPPNTSGSQRGNDLFSVPIEGGESVRLNSRLRNNVTVDRFVISPNSTQVIYRADENTFDQFELFGVPVAGGAVEQINSSLVTGGDVDISYRFDPSGDYVVYAADKFINGKRELFRASVSNGGIIKLSPDIPDSAATSNSFRFAAIPQRIVYTISNRVGDDFEFGLFSSRINDGDVAELRAIAPGRPSYEVSPIDDTVVYQDQGLRRVAATGGPSAVINSPDGSIGTSVRFSPDGQEISYLVLDESFTRKIHRSPLFRAGQAQLVSCPLASGERIDQFSYTPDGAWIVCSTSNSGTRLAGLFAVSLLNRPTLSLADRNGSGGRDFITVPFQISSDSQRVVFRYSDGRPGSRFSTDLFSSNLTSGAQQKVNIETGEGRTVGSFQFTANGQALIFTANEANQKQRLYLSELAPDDQMCVPIRASNNGFAVICI